MAAPSSDVGRSGTDRSASNVPWVVIPRPTIPWLLLTTWQAAALEQGDGLRRDMNVTAATMEDMYERAEFAREDMYERAEFAREMGSVLIMIDLTIGYTASIVRWLDAQARHKGVLPLLIERQQGGTVGANCIRPTRRGRCHAGHAAPMGGHL
jgi:hypothetical protein